jgi:hypothetical protein
MAVSSVASSTSAAAQLIEQARQANAKPEATETRAAEKPAEQRQDAKVAPQETPQPVVNTQGQTTGRVINTFA